MCKRFVIILSLLVIILLISCDSEKAVDPEKEIPKTWQTVRISDYDYLYGKYFDLGRITDFSEGDRITKIVLYKTIQANDSNMDTGVDARMYVDPNDTSLYSNENDLVSKVVEVSPKDYYVNYNEYWMMFTIDPILPGSQINYAVWMEITNESTVETVGNTATTPLSLKLIRNYRADSTFVTWDYMWRNVYSLAGVYDRNLNYIDLNGLEIRILKGDKDVYDLDSHLDYQNDADSTPYIQILGLDQNDLLGNSSPDNLTDVYDKKIVDPYNGLLIFPSRTPFNENSLSFIKDKDSVPIFLNEQAPEIYNQNYLSAAATGAGKYYLEVRCLEWSP